MPQAQQYHVACARLHCQACAHTAGQSFMVEYTFWKLTALSKKPSKDMGCKCLGAHPKTALQRCIFHI